MKIQTIEDFNILKICAEGLKNKIEYLEDKNINNFCKIRSDVEEELNCFLSVVFTEYKDIIDNNYLPNNFK